MGSMVSTSALRVPVGWVSSDCTSCAGEIEGIPARAIHKNIPGSISTLFRMTHPSRDGLISGGEREGPNPRMDVAPYCEGKKQDQNTSDPGFPLLSSEPSGLTPLHESDLYVQVGLLTLLPSRRPSHPV